MQGNHLKMALDKAGIYNHALWSVIMKNVRYVWKRAVQSLWLEMAIPHNFASALRTERGDYAPTETKAEKYAPACSSYCSFRFIQLDTHGQSLLFPRKTAHSAQQH